MAISERTRELKRRRKRREKSLKRRVQASGVRRTNPGPAPAPEKPAGEAKVKKTRKKEEG